MKNSAQILVIGGMNLDILGTAHTAFQAGDSLPGTIEKSPGGVARNIAAQLRSLGAGVELICPLGHDDVARQLAASCQQLDIGLSHALYTQEPSPSYLAIHDRDGNVVCAINDMRAMEAVTPFSLQPLLKRLPSFDACVLDANLSEDVVLYLANTLPFPLVADPVSAVKCHRLKPILNKLRAIKPNMMEAKALTGADSCEEAARLLLHSGVQEVFVSLGAEGVYYADGRQQGYLKAPALPHVPLTGAGDAMTAGLSLGIAKQLPIHETAALGIRSSARFLSSRQRTKSSEE